MNLIEKILTSHFCQNCLNVEERNEFIEDVFNKIMKDVTEHSKIDLKFINNEWFIKLLTLVCNYDCLDKIHNAKELINKIKDLGEMIND